VTMRSWLTGGVMFVLSVFPTILVFGAMGLLGIVVDIGSVMTPCVAVGVTVDDVIHFLLCHRRGVQQGMSVQQATRLAYSTCGRAMIQSWGIIGVGLSAFALSSFVPTFRFGMLMLLLLTAGLVGNLLFLPSVLSGPIGRWIARAPLPLAWLVHVSETPER
jgi:predicted RND superfamily exporter protein